MTLEDWAGSQHLSLALVFTDIVQSTEIGKNLGDTKWIRDLFLHFSRGRIVASGFDSYVVKVIGDALMLAFRSASDAVNFAIDFSENTGVDYIGIRVGINSGEVQIKDNDIYGLNVNFSSRVQHALTGEGILVATTVKRDYQQRFGEKSGIRFIPREVELKSFGKETLFWVATVRLLNARAGHWLARETLLGRLEQSNPVT